MGEKRRFRTNQFYSIAAYAKPVLPDLGRRMKLIIARHIERTNQPEYGIKNLTRNIRTILEKYGRDVLAKVIIFATDHDVVLYDYGFCLCLAEAVRDDREDLIWRTFAFLKKHKDKRFNGFSLIFDGIRDYGESAIEAGMRLTPMPVRADLHVTHRDWDLERTREDWRTKYAEFTARLGYPTVKRLLRWFRKEDFNSSQIMNLFYEIDCGRFSSWSSDEKEIELRNAIELVKSCGLKPSGFAIAVLEVLQRREGSIGEIREILANAKEHGVEDIRLQDLGLALMRWRRPIERDGVIFAFKEQCPHLLSWAHAGMMFTVTFTLPEIIGTPSETDLCRIMDDEYRKQAVLRTSEIISRRYFKMGILQSEQELVELFAQNPLIIGELWKRKRVLGSIDDILAWARAIYGQQAICEYISMAKSESELEFILALVAASPNRIKRILERAPATSYRDIVQTVYSFGVSATEIAFGIIRENELDPDLFIPIARALRLKGKGIAGVSKYLLPRVLSNEHEAAFRGFLALSGIDKKRLGRAIDLFRRVFDTTHERVNTNHVRARNWL